jgi:hypothetical protein
MNATERCVRRISIPTLTYNISQWIRLVWRPGLAKAGV